MRYLLDVNLDALALFEVEKISGGRAMTPALQTLSCSLLSMAETIGFYFPSITRGNVGYMMIYVNLGLSLVQQSTWNRLLVWNRLKIITLLVLYNTMPYCIMLYHTISHYITLYQSLPHFITLYHITYITLTLPPCSVISQVGEWFITCTVNVWNDDSRWLLVMT